jgi:hypothetical protein
MLKIGINHCSNTEYHADKEFLSSSNLKMLLKDRERFYREKILGERTALTGDHLDEGSLTHALILEPEVVSKEFAFYGGLRKSGEAYQLFKAANAGKLVISRPQQLRAESYFAAYKKNKAALALTKIGAPEHTICQNLSDVPVKVRCDWINVEEGYIADVKTTAFPADIDSFRNTINQWGYDLSAALYSTVAEQYYGKPFDFYFIVIDKKNLVCEVYKASQATLNKGKQQVVEALKIYKECKKTGNWTNIQKETKLELPEEAEYEIQDI